MLHTHDAPSTVLGGESLLTPMMGYEMGTVIHEVFHIYSDKHK